VREESDVDQNQSDDGDTETSPTKSPKAKTLQVSSALCNCRWIPWREFLRLSGCYPLCFTSGSSGQ
jgi:hypothetical protein